MDWDTNQLCEQGLGKTTDLRMAGYYSSKRTTITSDSVRPIALYQFCQSTEFIENVNGHLRACWQVAGQHVPLRGQALTCDPLPRRTPRCSTKPSRSRVARCARTALSVSRSSWASPSTVRLFRRSSRMICPRVLDKKRWFQYCCGIHSSNPIVSIPDAASFCQESQINH